MASLLSTDVGDLVGYKIRHESRRSSRTRILCCTEGVLVRMLQQDPCLSGVSAVVFDEFHERSVDGDFSLALCIEAQGARPDLRLVVMSATLGDFAPTISSLLGSCPTLRSEGKAYPVEISYRGTRPLQMAASGHPRDLEAEVASAVSDVLSSGGAAGDVLVFLPGEREIRNVRALLLDGGLLSAAAQSRLSVLPLYGALPLEEQRRAVLPDPQGKRRVVLSTNLAESSLTLEGVRYVVDSGLRRASSYDASTGMAALRTRPISAASAAQRAGRAGRVAAGTAVRLWTENEQRRLKPQFAPDIEEADLSGLLLQLGGWGAAVDDASVHALPWPTPPPKASLHRARQVLLGVGALQPRKGGGPLGVQQQQQQMEEELQPESSESGSPDGSGLELTAHGASIARLPMHPRLGHIVATSVAAAEPASASAGGALPADVQLACALAACLEERDILRGGTRQHGSDLRLRLRSLLLARSPPADATGAWHQARRNMGEIKRMARRQLNARARTNQGAAPAGDGDDESDTDGAGEAADDDIMAFTSARQVDLDSLIDEAGLLLAGAFSDRVAQRQPGKENVFSLANGRGASFASASEPLVQSDYLVAVALDGGDKASARLHLAAPVRLDGLRRVLAHRITSRDECFLVPSDGSVRARRVERLGALILSQTPLPAPPPERARGILLSALRERGLARTLLSGGAGSPGFAARELIGRVRFMAAAEPDGAWPRWTEQSLVEGAEEWLAPALDSGANSLKSLAKADLAQLLHQTLPYELQSTLAAAAPTQLTTPSGNRASLRYVADDADPFAPMSSPEEGAPRVASKLQEWFGATETPLIGPDRRRVAVVLELLSPRGAPLTTTQDLPSFFGGAYASVRAEMRGKYPKHPWPEDPMSAAPTAKTNKQLRDQGQSTPSRSGDGDGATATGKRARKGARAAKKAKKGGGRR